MIKIMMHGCCGHMGQVISELVEKDPEAEITVGVDIADKGNTSYPVYTDLSACQEDVDVLIFLLQKQLMRFLIIAEKGSFLWFCAQQGSVKSSWPG